MQGGGGGEGGGGWRLHSAAGAAASGVPCWGLIPCWALMARPRPECRTAAAVWMGVEGPRARVESASGAGSASGKGQRRAHMTLNARRALSAVDIIAQTAAARSRACGRGRARCCRPIADMGSGLGPGAWAHGFGFRASARRPPSTSDAPKHRRRAIGPRRSEQTRRAAAKARVPWRHGRGAARRGEAQRAALRTARKACPVPWFDTMMSIRLKADSPLAMAPCSATMPTLGGCFVGGRRDRLSGALEALGVRFGGWMARAAASHRRFAEQPAEGHRAVAGQHHPQKTVQWPDPTPLK
jgi:hypothetical protein